MNMLRHISYKKDKIMNIEIISSIERLNQILDQWSGGDLTKNGLLSMQSIYGDMICFQLDMSNKELFIKSVLAYEQDKDREWGV